MRISRPLAIEDICQALEDVLRRSPSARIPQAVCWDAAGFLVSQRGITG